MNNEHARDLTQAERKDTFGTTDMDGLIDICQRREIPYSITRNRMNIVIWRCHLPRHFQMKLERMERSGRVYVGGFRGSAS